MPARIISVPLGLTDCYLIQEDNDVIMIDGGTPGNINTFKTAIAKHSIQPSDIKLIIVTHGHIDHIGSYATLKNSLVLKLPLITMTYNVLSRAIG